MATYTSLKLRIVNRLFENTTSKLAFVLSETKGEV